MTPTPTPRPCGWIDATTPVGTRLIFPPGIETDGDDCLPPVLVYRGAVPGFTNGYAIVRFDTPDGKAFPTDGTSYTVEYWNQEFSASCVATEPPGKGAKTMRSGILSLVLVAVLFAAGCSSLQANPAATQLISAGAAAAQGNVTATDTTAALTANAAVFKAVHGTATLNGFAYLFGGKAVLANASIFTVIQQVAAIEDEGAKRAAAGTLSPASAAVLLSIENQYAKDAVLQLAASPMTASLVTTAKIKTVVAPKTARLAMTTAQVADLQNLIDQLPNALKPWAAQYGPMLLRLGLAEADALVALLLKGDQDTPYRAALSTMTEAEFMAEAGNVMTLDANATNANAQAVAAERQAAMALLTVGISILLSALGL